MEFIPNNLEEGILYISDKYKTAAHKCCCGCGEEVITPLNPTDWSVKIINDRVTLYPSIGNWSFTCKSHYWIKNGKIKWSYQMTEAEIQLGRDRDQLLKDRYFKQINQEKEKPSPKETISKQYRKGWLKTVLDKIKYWMSN
ncbi:MAG: DUF6527 family protein [Candidatus Thiodiazotropha sp.]